MLIPAGRLADRYGHKRLFLIGLIGFTLTSILCGTASSPQTLIGWRVAQGAMAGMLNPAILAIIQVTFPPQERGKAFGMYGAVSGVAVAMGPLLGGLLIQANLQGLDWRPIFLLNLRSASSPRLPRSACYRNHAAAAARSIWSAYCWWRRGCSLSPCR